MWRARLIVLGLGVLIASGVAFFFLVIQPALQTVRPAAPIVPTPALLRQVQGLNDLVTVKYVLEKVVLLEDVKWYGENRVLLVAHGVVKAGVNLQKLKPGDLQVDGQRVTIRLPAPEITDVYLDEKNTQVVERTTGVLRGFDKNLEQSARRQAVESLHRAAKYGGILREADQRARDQMATLFRWAGFSEVVFAE